MRRTLATAAATALTGLALFAGPGAANAEAALPDSGNYSTTSYDYTADDITTLDDGDDNVWTAHFDMYLDVDSTWF